MLAPRALVPALRDELLAVAGAAADAARAAVLPWFRRPDLGVDNKSADGFDPVTEADRLAEAAMRAVIADARPHDAIHGEEQAPRPGTSGLSWILDPVDGTRGFLSGTPTWGVLVAVADGDGPLLGVIDQPYIGERFIGAPGLARFEGPRGAGALATRGPRPLSEAIVFSTFPEVGTPAERAGFAAVAGRARLVRYGMDCYAYALLALGQIDLVIEAGLHPHDIAAPIAVIEAAGGHVTDWRGGPAHGGGQVVAAANETILAEALALLAPHAAAPADDDGTPRAAAR